MLLGKEFNKDFNNKRKQETINMISNFIVKLRLVQKYMNFMKELESHQHQEIIRFDKAAKMQSNFLLTLAAANFSKATSMSRALQSIQSRN